LFIHYFVYIKSYQVHKEKEEKEKKNTPPK